MAVVHVNGSCLFTAVHAMAIPWAKVWRHCHEVGSCEDRVQGLRFCCAVFPKLRRALHPFAKHYHHHHHHHPHRHHGHERAVTLGRGVWLGRVVSQLLFVFVRSTLTSDALHRVSHASMIARGACCSRVARFNDATPSNVLLVELAASKVLVT